VTARQDEFERIAMPHARSLLRVARRLAADPAAAEDAVQEALLRAWRSFDRFKPGTNARAWLFQIMIRELYAQGRKLHSRPQLEPLDIETDRGAPLRSAKAGFLEAAEVNRALYTLSPAHRTVLLLTAVEGFTCREVAQILSVPIGTVMSRLSRARQTFRERLEQIGTRNEYQRQEAS
jgi:RNA polymerase sigma-70 factor, ECF subfamily